MSNIKEENTITKEENDKSLNKPNENVDFNILLQKEKEEEENKKIMKYKNQFNILYITSLVSFLCFFVLVFIMRVLFNKLDDTFFGGGPEIFAFLLNVIIYK